jgi:hypothetical protein
LGRLGSSIVPIQLDREIVAMGPDGRAASVGVPRAILPDRLFEWALFQRTTGGIAGHDGTTIVRNRPEGRAELLHDARSREAASPPQQRAMRRHEVLERGELGAEAAQRAPAGARDASV